MRRIPDNVYETRGLTSRRYDETFRNEVQLGLVRHFRFPQNEAFSLMLRGVGRG
jgi:hypothetical protein